jgi:hypothetical protein
MDKHTEKSSDLNCPAIVHGYPYCHCTKDELEVSLSHTEYSTPPVCEIAEQEAQ